MMLRSLRNTFLAFFAVLSILFIVAPSTASAQVIYSTNFDNFTATNWQGWSSDNGMWLVGSPTAGPKSAHSGKQCVSEGLTGNYTGGRSSRLISPAITIPKLATGQAAVLNFWQWFQFDGGDWNHSPSYGEVEVSVWSGASWGDWAAVSDGEGGDSSGWMYSGTNFPYIDLSSFSNKKIRIGFNHIGNGLSAAGWFIDDLTITQVTLASQSFNQSITFENFTSTNWQGWSADNGVWQVGIPTAGPKAAFDGKQCASTGLTGNYPSGRTSGLTSPPITLPAVGGGQSLVMGYWQWFQFDGGDWNHSPSFGGVEVSVWNGTGWGTWVQVSRSIGNNSNGWSYATVDLSNYASKKIIIKFNHHCNGLTAAGWFIDDINFSVVQDMVINQKDGLENVTWNNWQGWSADNGMWGIGGTKVGPGSAYNGKQCASTGLLGNYPGGQDSRLISRPVSLPKIVAGQGLAATLWQWFQFDGGDWNHSPSYGVIEVSSFGANGWSDWKTVSTGFAGSSNGWAFVGTTFAAIDLTAFAGQRIRLAFHHVGQGLSAAGWFIDDIIVAVQPTIVSFSPASGTAGITSVTITGTQFTGATEVDFNGTSATFTVNSDTKITAVVPVGATSGSISVTTPGGTAMSDQSFTVLPPLSLTKFVLSPATLSPTLATTGTVTLSVAAPTGGVTVSFTSDNAALPVPPNVFIAAGQTAGSFTATAGNVTSTVNSTVTATLVGSALKASVAISPWVKSVTVSPASIAAGKSATMTVTLNNPAPVGGLIIPVSSNNGIASIVDANGKALTSLTVPAGTSTGTATVITFATAFTQSVTLSAGAAGVAQTCMLTVTPGGATVTLLPATVNGGVGSTGFVTMTAAAPTGGSTITLASSDATVTMPANVIVPAGKKTASFAIKTTVVAVTKAVTITATLGTAPGSAVLTVKAPPVIGYLQLVPNTVSGGDNTLGLITLNGNGFSSDVTVSIGTSNSGLTKPDKSVVIPAGFTSAVFNVDTLTVKTNTTVTIFVTINGQRLSANLTVTP